MSKIPSQIRTPIETERSFASRFNKRTTSGASRNRSRRDAPPLCFRCSIQKKRTRASQRKRRPPRTLIAICHHWVMKLPSRGSMLWDGARKVPKTMLGLWCTSRVGAFILVPRGCRRVVHIVRDNPRTLAGVDLLRRGSETPNHLGGQPVSQ